MRLSRWMTAAAAMTSLTALMAGRAAGQATQPVPTQSGAGNTPQPSTTTPAPAAPAPAPVTPAPPELPPIGSDQPVTPADETPAPPPVPVEVQPMPALPAPPPQLPALLEPEQAYHGYVPPSRFGMSIMLGGGVGDYPNSVVHDNTSLSGSWDLRLAFGTRLWFGGEVDYVGAASGINNLGLASSSTLVRNGLEGVLRINAPLRARGTLLEPYIFGGVGWNHYNVNASSATADLNVGDNTLSVPAGAGFTFGSRAFLADVRATYRPTYFQQLFISQPDTALTNWSVDFTVGYEF